MSKQIEIRPATKSDLAYVGENLRLADFEEYVMSTGRHPAKRFARSLDGVPDLLCGTVNGRPACIFGCYAGRPWFLGTEDIEGPQVGLVMAKEGRKLFRQWASEQPDGTLSNEVYDDNVLHKRYIELLGCTLSDRTITKGPLGGIFRPFTFTYKA